jgi:hypothetical protein
MKFLGEMGLVLLFPKNKDFNMCPNTTWGIQVVDKKASE